MSKPIYKTLNEAAGKIGIESNLNENSSFEEISEMFETIHKWASEDIKRKIRLEYKLYAIEAQASKNNDNVVKMSGKELVDLLNNYDNAEVSSDPYQRETDEILKFFDNKENKFQSTTKHYKLQNSRDIKETRGLNKGLSDKTKLKITIVVLGVLCAVMVYSAVQLHNNYVAEAEPKPVSVSNVQSDEGEYEIIEYEIQYGDYNKEIIAKKLGIRPIELVVVGDLSDQPGDIVLLKVYNKQFLAEYNYYKKPVVKKTYYGHIESGEKMEKFFGEMMATYPELEDYYFGESDKNNSPYSLFVKDLAKCNGTIEDENNYMAGAVRLDVVYTQAFADGHNITSDNIKK